jgi:hypothetical protein
MDCIAPVGDYVAVITQPFGHHRGLKDEPPCLLKWIEIDLNQREAELHESIEVGCKGASGMLIAKKNATDSFCARRQPSATRAQAASFANRRKGKGDRREVRHGTRGVGHNAFP